MIYLPTLASPLVYFCLLLLTFAEFAQLYFLCFFLLTLAYFWLLLLTIANFWLLLLTFAYPCLLLVTFAYSCLLLVTFTYSCLLLLTLAYFCLLFLALFSHSRNEFDLLSCLSKRMFWAAFQFFVFRIFNIQGSDFRLWFWFLMLF